MPWQRRGRGSDARKKRGRSGRVMVPPHSGANGAPAVKQRPFRLSMSDGRAERCPIRSSTRRVERAAGRMRRRGAHTRTDPVCATCQPTAAASGANGAPAVRMVRARRANRVNCVNCLCLRTVYAIYAISSPVRLYLRTICLRTVYCKIAYYSTQVTRQKPEEGGANKKRKPASRLH